MWLWLQRKLPRRFSLLAKLFLCASCLHSILLVMIFFIYRGDSFNYAIEVRKNLQSDAEIVFLPFQKRVKQNISGSKNRSKNGCAKQTAKAVPAQKIAEPKKEVKATTVASVKEKKVVQPKKRVKPKVEKKVAPAKKEKVKEVVKQEKKEVEKPAESKPTAQPAAQQDAITTSTALPSASNAADINYVGQYDLDALRMQEYINDEIAKNWSPPVGIAKDRQCDINLLIDWQGKVNAIKIVKSSGVLIYDISARKAVQAMEMPKWLWGKEITIAFKQ